MPANYEDELKRSFWTVLREGDHLSDAAGRLARTYRRLAERLDLAGVNFTVVGGYALIVHGVRRFTEDVDLLVNREGLAKLRDDLIGHGYVTIPGNARDMRDAETGVRIEFVVTGEYPGDGRESPVAFPDPRHVSEERQGIRVVTLESLIELKLASGLTAKGRLQDLADVQRLIQEHNLRPDYADRLNPYVQAKFRELAAP